MRLSGVILIFCVFTGANGLFEGWNPFAWFFGNEEPAVEEPVDDRAARFSAELIGQSATDIASGVAGQAGTTIPTPQELFNIAKQIIAGLPFVLLSNLINAFCSAAITSQTIRPKFTPNIDEIQFQLRTKCQTEYFSLNEAKQLMRSRNFDPQKKVVVLASGWILNVNETEMIRDIAKAYHCRDDTNVIAVDSTYFIDTLYSWSAFNTDDLGNHIAVGLKEIAEAVGVEKIHLVGHSLGAHILGAAARYFNLLTGKTIRRITALDAAKPCFNEGEQLSGLMRGDADFIDAIHSNSDVLGKREPIGDADFYPGGLGPLPPGCNDVVCAHGRSWEYFEESVYPRNENNFMSTRCSGLQGVRDGKCVGQKFPMGYAVPHNLKGNYFLEVNSRKPYGVNASAQNYAIRQSCGLCEIKGGSK